MDDTANSASKKIRLQQRQVIDTWHEKNHHGTHRVHTQYSDGTYSKVPFNEIPEPGKLWLPVFAGAIGSDAAKAWPSADPDEYIPIFLTGVGCEDLGFCLQDDGYWYRYQQTRYVGIVADYQGNAVYEALTTDIGYQPDCDVWSLFYGVNVWWECKPPGFLMGKSLLTEKQFIKLPPDSSYASGGENAPIDLACEEQAPDNTASQQPFGEETQTPDDGVSALTNEISGQDNTSCAPVLEDSQDIETPDQDVQSNIDLRQDIKPTDDFLFDFDVYAAAQTAADQADIETLFPQMADIAIILRPEDTTSEELEKLLVNFEASEAAQEPALD